MATAPRKGLNEWQLSIVTYYREMAGTMAGDPAVTDKLSNVQVWAMLQPIEAEYDPNEDEDSDAQMAKAQKLIDARPVVHDDKTQGQVATPLPSTSGASPVRSRAIDAGKRIGEDTVFIEHANKLHEAKLENSIGTLQFVDDLIRIFGDGDETKAMQVINGDKDNMGWPMAGTWAVAKKVQGVEQAASNNPDHFQTKVTKADGTEGTRWTTFFAEMVEAMPHGRKLREQSNILENAELAAKHPTYGNMGPTQRKQELSKISGWRTTTTNNLRKARKYFAQLAALQEHGKGKYFVRIARVLDKDGEPTAAIERTNKPLVVGVITKPESAETLTVTQFLSYRPALLKEISMAALKTTVKRKGTGSSIGAAGSGTSVALLAIREADDLAMKQVNSFDQEEWQAKMEKHWLSSEGEMSLANHFQMYNYLAHHFGQGGAFRKLGAAAQQAVAAKEIAAKEAALPDEHKTGKRVDSEAA